MSDRHTGTPSDKETHEHVAALIRAVDVQAPALLHTRIQEMIAARAHTSRKALAPRLKPALAAMAAAAAAGAILALLSGGATRALSVREASALTLRAATMPAPRESGTRGELNIAVEGIPFPYWKERFGWRSTGAREDTLRGRRITTVFYSGANGGRIGYAIVSGTPAPGVSGGTVAWRAGVRYWLLRQDGAPMVVWQREGRLCVLSGQGMSDALLLRLASSDRARPA